MGIQKRETGIRTWNGEISNRKQKRKLDNGVIEVENGGNRNEKQGIENRKWGAKNGIRE